MNVGPILAILYASASKVEVPDPGPESIPHPDPLDASMLPDRLPGPLLTAPDASTLTAWSLPAPTRRRWNGDTEAPGTRAARVERGRARAKAAKVARRKNRRRK